MLNHSFLIIITEAYIRPIIFTKWPNLLKLPQAKIGNLVSPAWVKYRREFSIFSRPSPPPPTPPRGLPPLLAMSPHSPAKFHRWLFRSLPLHCNKGFLTSCLGRVRRTFRPTDGRTDGQTHVLKEDSFKESSDVKRRKVWGNYTGV